MGLKTAQILTTPYLRKHAINERVEYKNYWNIVVFVTLAIINIVYKILVENFTLLILHKEMFGELLWTNTSPIMLGEAIFLLLFFSRLKIGDHSIISRVVSFITPLVFAVYIIHVHPCIFWNDVVVNTFAPLAEFNPVLTLLMVLVIAVIVFLICIILDFFRAMLFKKLKVRLLCDKVGNWISMNTYKILKIK